MVGRGVGVKAPALVAQPDSAEHFLFGADQAVDDDEALCSVELVGSRAGGAQHPFQFACILATFLEGGDFFGQQFLGLIELVAVDGFLSLFGNGLGRCCSFTLLRKNAQGQGQQQDDEETTIGHISVFSYQI